MNLLKIINRLLSFRLSNLRKARTTVRIIVYPYKYNGFYEAYCIEKNISAVGVGIDGANLCIQQKLNKMRHVEDIHNTYLSKVPRDIYSKWYEGRILIPQPFIYHDFPFDLKFRLIKK